MLNQYLLDKAVHTTRKFCSVACSCLGKAVQMLATDVHLVYLDVESQYGVLVPNSKAFTCRGSCDLSNELLNYYASLETYKLETHDLQIGH